MVAATRPPANGFVAALRRVYNPIGFGKGYNFILWFIFSGALFGFCLARFMFLDFSGVYCPLNSAGSANSAGPGECYSYKTSPVYLIGIKLHLFTIIPAGFLACFQFVPWIRLNYILAHRINGYLVLMLSAIGTAGAIMIARVAFGGSFETRVGTGLLAIMFVCSLGISLFNIKMLQLEQHRAWMLRAWFYAGSIITARLIMFISALILSSNKTADPYYLPISCDKLTTFYDNTTSLVEAHPACSDRSAWSISLADMSGKVENVAAALSITFSAAFLLSLAIHAIGVEFYLQLTPAESERLRKISYQKQLEAGFSNPGGAGLTADRLGDAAIWTPDTVANTTYMHKESSTSSD